jgi:hypothetical protein
MYRLCSASIHADSFTSHGKARCPKPPKEPEDNADEGDWCGNADATHASDGW